jgi:V/A-type H+/Na+-transporting ATPase subunit I
VSIVPLVRATVIGLEGDGPRLLTRLQDLGLMHIVPLAPAGDDLPAPPGSLGREREALRILERVRPRRRPVGPRAAFDPEAVVARVLDVQEAIEALTFERDHLEARIATLAPWGDFTLPALEDLSGQRLWFYVVPAWRLSEMPDTVPWEVVHREANQAYVVALSPDEPEDIPFPRSHTGSRSLSQLQDRLETVMQELEDRRADRAALTRWRDRLQAHHDAQRDARALDAVSRQSFRSDGMLAVQGWIAEDAVPRLRELAEELRLALTIEPPDPEETPPTLLRNPEWLAGGEEMVRFYSLPGYRSSDPSVPLFFAFSIFFAMILSDAGYGLLLAVVLALVFRPLGRSRTGRRLRRLGTVLVVCTITYGALVGSWFGLAPPYLDAVAILDPRDTQTMMAICLVIGLAHVMLGNLQETVARWGSWAVLAPIGWILGLVAGSLAGLIAMAGLAVPMVVPAVLGGVAGLLILLFADTGPFPPRTFRALGGRIMGGLGKLFNVTQAFGDVMSYLRLFALGLASASLAATFNDLAGQVSDLLPGVGLVLAGVILLLGHGVNLALAVVGGIVHGLRLNVIEYYHWAVPEEGTEFLPFKRTGEEPWT